MKTILKASRFDEVETFEDGEIIQREGDEGREMRIIQRGQVIVSKKVGESEVPLGILKRGSFFGEMSLLDSLPQSTTVRAQGETRVLVIGAASLLLKIRRDPTFAFEMLQHMSRQARYLQERLVAALSDEQELEVATRAAYAEWDSLPEGGNGA
jgi:CRP-like cAMP-binding protein